MNRNLPKITHSTLRSLLLLRISEAIYLKNDVPVTNCAVADPHLSKKSRNSRILAPHSMLKRVKSATSVAAYSSAIALQLGAESMQIREEIAARIIDFLQHALPNSLEEGIEKQLLRDLTVSATEAGQLLFEFSDRAIAVYLQETLAHCMLQPPQPPEAPVLALKGRVSGDSDVFLCQYSYARCAALIRMQPRSTHSHEGVESDPAIWLKNGRLLFEREIELLAQIITTLDEWQDKPALDLAVSLSKGFQAFYRDCQIVKYDAINLQLAQCRLGLVMITHWLLQQLLQHGLGVSVPETL